MFGDGLGMGAGMSKGCRCSKAASKPALMCRRRAFVQGLESTSRPHTPFVNGYVMALHEPRGGGRRKREAGGKRSWTWFGKFGGRRLKSWH